MKMRVIAHAIHFGFFYEEKKNVPAMDLFSEPFQISGADVLQEITCQLYTISKHVPTC